MEKQKYIVYLIPKIYPCATGGMEIFYNKLIREVSGHYNVMVLTSCERYSEDKVKILRIKNSFLGLPGTSKVAVLLSTLFTLIKIRNQIKVVHLPYTSIAGRWGYVLPLAGKICDFKYILHLHGGGMKKWKRFSGNKMLFKYASKIIAVSEIIRKEYSGRSGRNIEVVYPLVPFQKSDKPIQKIRSERGFEKSDRIILFVGSLKGLKAPNVLFEAFSRLGRDFIDKNNLKLVFVGDGPMRSELEERAKREKQDRNIHFTGLVPNEEVADFYKMADIYVISSHFEGTPKSLLEAMHNKLPIVGSDVEGINNILSNNVDSLLFERDNGTQLSHHLEELIKAKDKSAVFANRAYEKYRKLFSFDNTLKSLMSVYNHF